MVTTLVGIVGAILGLLVGKLWDNRDEGRRWLRDAQAAASVDYVNAYQHLRIILRRVAVMDRASEGWNQANDARPEVWQTYNAALIRVELYGEPGVYEAALVTDTMVREVSEAVLRERMSVKDWHEVRVGMDSAMGRCVDAIRGEFGLKPHQDRSAWVMAAPDSQEPAVS